MAPSKERGSRPGRRIIDRRCRPSTGANYSHINIKPASEDTPMAGPLDPATFVVRPSLQDTIDEDLAYATKVASSGFREDSPPGNRPTTFAEAAMSTRIRGTMGGGSRDAEKQDSPAGLGSRAFETLGTLRQTKKRKKAQKWAALDLSTVDDIGDVVGNRAPTPPPLSPTFVVPTAFQSTQPQPQATSTPPIPSADIDNRLEIEPEGIYSGIPSPKGKEVVREKSDLPSTAQAASTYREAPSIYHNNLRPETTALDKGNLNDSPETKRNFENVMAHLNQYVTAPAISTPGQDAFDSITWDPDLPQGSYLSNKTPEMVASKPKPALAYTTVGSVVNPNNVPQFSAPNRIQREGAGRRPLMAMSNRQYDSLLQPRGHNAPLNMQNSMQYTQRLQQIPPTYDVPRPRVPVSMNQLPPSVLLLTEQEKFVLGKLEEAIQKIPLNARKAVSTAPSTISSASSSAAAFRPRLILNDEDVKRAYGIQGMRQGLEKMQTLQRLARFENPMREHALSRLSEFSVLAQAASKRNHSSGIQESVFRSQQSTEDLNDLDPGFRFSPASLAVSSTVSTANPLYGAYSSSTFNNSAQSTRPPGYPKPLTAGPPGQRHANQAFLTARIMNSGMHAADPGSSVMMARRSSSHVPYINSDCSYQSAPTAVNTYSAMAGDEEQTLFDQHSSCRSEDLFRQFQWYSNLQFQQKAALRIHDVAVAPVDQGPHTNLFDTIPIDMMIKYFPNGPPMTVGYSVPTDEETEIGNDVSKENFQPNFLPTKKQKAELDNFFYYGQRRYFMTGEDHVIELEGRETVSSGPIEPLSRGSVVPAPFTHEQVEKMTIPEAIKPAIDGLFGTLLSYAESSEKSRKKRSGWVNGPQKYIDDSVEGNKSCFGEDWGNTRNA